MFESPSTARVVIEALFDPNFLPFEGLSGAPLVLQSATHSYLK